MGTPTTTTISEAQLVRNVNALNEALRKFQETSAEMSLVSKLVVTNSKMRVLRSHVDALRVYADCLEQYGAGLATYYGIRERARFPMIGGKGGNS